MDLQTAIGQADAQTWELAPQSLELRPGEVHIWRGSLIQHRSEVKELWSLLSTEEQMCASRFHFPEDSDRYILTHGMLRQILLRYQTLVPAPHCISRGPKGQPYLHQRSEGPGLRFSLSHSKLLGLFAITLGRRVGIDLEPKSNAADWQAMANRFFPALESQYLFALPQAQRGHAFLSRWTQKEAYVKARGEGLSIPLDSFRILASRGGTVRVEDSHDSTAGMTWSLLEITPDEHHFGALAMEGDPAQVLFWDCKPTQPAL